MIKKFIRFSFFTLFLVFKLLPTIGQGLYNLPNFKIERLPDNSRVIVWKNQFKDNCSKICVQRSVDGISAFNTIFLSPNPKEYFGAFKDTNKLIGKKVYYRILYIVKGENYYDLNVITSPNQGSLLSDDEVINITDIKTIKEQTTIGQDKKGDSYYIETIKSDVEKEIPKERLSILHGLFGSNVDSVVSASVRNKQNGGITLPPINRNEKIKFETEKHARNRMNNHKDDDDDDNGKGVNEKIFIMLTQMCVFSLFVSAVVIIITMR